MHLNEKVQAYNDSLKPGETSKLKTPILTGRDAEMAVGMQHEFAADILLHTFHSGTAISFRAGSPPSYDAIRSPKSGAVLSKSSNHGMGKSLICADPLFTRLDGFRRPIGHHDKDSKHLQENSQPLVQLRHSIRDILEMTGKKPKGDLEIVGYNPENGQLIIKYQKGQGPAGFEGEFVVNIREANKPKVDRVYTRPWNKPMTPPQDAIDAAKKFGIDLKDLLDDEVPINYRETRGAALKPFKVFSDKWDAKDSPGSPITGDWDLLAVGHPPETPTFARQVFNTFDQKQDSGGFTQQKKLIEATEKLFQIEKLKALKSLKQVLDRNRGMDAVTREREAAGGSGEEDAEAEIKKYQAILQGIENRDEAIMAAFMTLDPVQKFLIMTPHSGKLYDKISLERAGCITPYEFLQERILNKAYSDPKSVFGPQAFGERNPEFDPNLKGGPIQHGAEDRSPYAPSDLDGKMLHFYKGVIYMTTGEDQLIDFYMAGDFLENNIIDLQFGWNMAKWGRVLDRQAALGQINLDNPTDPTNTAQQQIVASTYRDYKAALKMQAELETDPSSFKMDAERVVILQRLLMHYQKLPDSLHDQMVLFYQDPRNLASHPLSELVPGSFKLKDLKWPIEKWAPVIATQLKLHEQEGSTVPAVPKDLLESYRNYQELLKHEHDAAISPRVIELIEKQMQFNQHSSIPAGLQMKYDLRAREELQSPRGAPSTPFFAKMSEQDRGWVVTGPKSVEATDIARETAKSDKQSDKKGEGIGPKGSPSWKPPKA